MAKHPIRNKRGMNALINLVVGVIAVGLIAMLGIVMGDKLAEAAYNTVSMTNVSFAIPDVTTNGSIGYGNLTSTPVIKNATGSTLNTTITGNFTFYLTAGIIYNGFNANDGTCNASTTCYLWITFRDYHTAAYTASESNTAALATVPNTWLAIVIVIFVIIFMLGLFMGSFKGLGGGQQR